MLLRRLGVTAVVTAILIPALTLVGATPALADEVATLIEEAEASPDGTVRVMVQLDVVTVPEVLLTSRAATRQRDAIDAEASDVVAEVGAVQTFETLPYVALDATPEDLEALAASDAVRDIERTVVARPLLDSSLVPVQAMQTTAEGWTGSGWNVAVLDTGVETSHPFLGGRVVEQACFSSGDLIGDGVGDCPNGAATDFGDSAGAACTFASNDCGHGTHVAGIVAGSQAAGSAGPTQGVAPGAGIVAIQVFSDTNRASATENAGTHSNDIAAALDWVLDNHTDLSITAVNLSLGGGLYAATCDTVSSATTTAITALRVAGVATVVASGNDSQLAQISWPACVSTAVSVGSVSDADLISAFTNVSPFISLLAPGEAIESSVPGGGFAALQGTSMAAPHVAGAWAVVRQAVPSASVDTALAALRSTGVLIDDVITQDIPRIELRDALLSLHPRPGAVTGVSGTAVSGEVSLAWTAPQWSGTSAVTDYQVSVSPVVANPTRTVGSTTTSFTFTGLADGTPYTFSIAAVSASGVGDAVTSAQLTPVALPGAPTGVLAAPAHERALVSWTSPADDGGSPITSYVVTPTPGTALSTSSTSHALTGLETGVPVSITVAAVNALGTSPSSAAVVVTPLAAVAAGGGGGGGGGGGATTPSTTSTTQLPSTTTTTRPAPTTTSTTILDAAPAPGASMRNGDVVTIRDGEPVVIARSAPPGADVVAGAATPSGKGAWTVSSTGEVFTSGDAADLGDTADRRLNAPIVSIAPTPTGNGYWLLGRDGGIFTFGDAGFFGSTGGMRLNEAVVGMASSPSGAGYWLFAGDGGIFTFGDADFFGSTGARTLNAPITTMAATPDARGYWLLGSDGGVFTFGTARFFGSTGDRTDVPPIEALVPTATGRGYWLIGNDGRILRFGDAT